MAFSDIARLRNPCSGGVKKPEAARLPPVSVNPILRKTFSLFYLGYVETLCSPGFSLQRFTFHQFNKTVQAFRALEAWGDIFHLEDVTTVETSICPHPRTPPDTYRRL
jgi:hypothetical protein